MEFHRKVFGSTSNRPHIFIDAGIGKATVVGHRRSTINPELMDVTNVYMNEYVKFAKNFKFKDVGITASWKMQTNG